MNQDNPAKTSDAKSSAYHKPHTVEDVTGQNVETIMRLEDAAKTNRDLTDRRIYYKRIIAVKQIRSCQISDNDVKLFTRVMLSNWVC